MSTFLRRIRGAVGNGTVWAIVWIAARLVTVGLGSFIAGTSLAQFMAVLVPVAVSAGVMGFMSGVTFAALFGALNRRRALAEVGGPSTALVGGAAGVLFPAAVFGFLLFADAQMAPISMAIDAFIGITLGASIATASLRPAQGGGDPLGGGHR